jgi:hypothetical protein
MGSLSERCPRLCEQLLARLCRGLKLQNLLIRTARNNQTMVGRQFLKTRRQKPTFCLRSVKISSVLTSRCTYSRKSSSVSVVVSVGLCMHRFPERWIIVLPRCLPVEKFPTSASHRQDRGATTLSGSRCRFHLTRLRDVA